MDAGLSLESSFADSHDLSAGKVRLLHTGTNLPRPTNSFSHLFLFIFLFIYIYICRIEAKLIKFVLFNE